MFCRVATGGNSAAKIATHGTAVRSNTGHVVNDNPIASRGMARPSQIRTKTLYACT